MNRDARHLGAAARGMTLLELLIALAITAMVSLAIAAVTTSIARGMESMHTARSALQRTVAAHTRLRAYMGTALCVLDADPQKGFAIWLGDTRANGRVNLSELRVFWFDPESLDGDLTVEWAEFPEDWDDQALAAADLELTGVDDYFDSMATLRSAGHTGTAILADEVRSFSVAHEGASLQDASRIRMEMGIDTGEAEPREILMAFGLSSHRAPE